MRKLSTRTFVLIPMLIAVLVILGYVNIPQPAGLSITNVFSKLRSVSRLRLTAGELYIATFIAGATKRGPVQLMKQRLTGSSAMP